MGAKPKYDKVALYAEWKTGVYRSRLAMAEAKGIAPATMNKIIKTMSKKLSPVQKVDKLGVELAAKEIAERLVVAQERQGLLGKKMQERALAKVDGIEVRDAGQLSNLATAGVSIERKALGLKDGEDRDNKIVIQMVGGGINIGGAMVGREDGIIEGEVVKGTDA